MLEASTLWILTYRYWVIVPLAIIEGPVVMLLCGFLVRLGGLEFLLAYVLLMVGDFIGDVLWYLVGRYGARSLLERFGHLVSMSMADLEHLERLFKNHGIKILFISKITMGLGFALATLVAAGAAHVPFGKYALINVLGGFVWTALLMGAGYYFGEAYLAFDAGLRNIFLVAMLVVVVLALRGFSRYVRKRVSNI